MKKEIYAAAMMLMLIGILAVTAEAQSVNGVSIRANIPFEFSVGDKLLPAGEYRIQQVNPFRCCDAPDREREWRGARNGASPIDARPRHEPNRASL